MKKILAVLFLTGCSVALNASSLTVECTETTNGNNAAGGAGNPVITNSVFSCASLAGSLPGGDILQQVSILISNSFSQATFPATDQINFSYTSSGFNGFSTLTTSTFTNNSTSSNVGGIVGGSPVGETCVNVDATDLTCTQTGAPTAVAFTITGSDTWISGSQTSTGSNGFNVYETYTYTGPAPEPASLMMVGGGLLGLGLIVRRKRKA
jgi:hypothetical protein